MDFDTMFSVMFVLSVLGAVVKAILQFTQALQITKTFKFAQSHTAEEWYDTDSVAFMEGQMKFQREMQTRQQSQAGQDLITYQQRQSQQFMNDMQNQQFQQFVDESMNYGLQSVTPFDMGGFL